jgi:hypothetical protein
MNSQDLSFGRKKYFQKESKPINHECLNLFDCYLMILMVTQFQIARIICIYKTNSFKYKCPSWHLVHILTVSSLLSIFKECSFMNQLHLLMIMSLPYIDRSRCVFSDDIIYLFIILYRAETQKKSTGMQKNSKLFIGKIHFHKYDYHLEVKQSIVKFPHRK